MQDSLQNFCKFITALACQSNPDIQSIKKKKKKITKVYLKLNMLQEPSSHLLILPHMLLTLEMYWGRLVRKGDETLL